MIITCPNCQTRYKVAVDQVSATGRQVQCATCNTAWLATPTFPKPPGNAPDPEPTDDELAFRADKDTLFTAADESMLDDAFVREARQEMPVADSLEYDGEMPGAPVDVPPPKPMDPRLASARTSAIAKRRAAMMSKLPLARFRRAARLAIAMMLAVVLIALVSMRTEIVRAVPELDTLYRAVGLGTNVVGLDFTDVKTLRTTRDGNGVIIVTAKISNITNRVTYVPSVLVSLLDSDDRVIYEWTVAPAARNILPGDVLGIDTQLTAPPENIDRVRLSFVEGQKRAEASGPPDAR